MGVANGPGPVFGFEMAVSSRRWHGYALRSLFVTFLLVTMVVLWSGRLGPGANPSLRRLAEFGETFFLGVVGTQLVLVLLAAPAATAGAITLDRSRGVLTHLLVTDLSDREIVLGKLGARLVPVLSMVACGLPVLALLGLLGGVDSDALIGALLITFGLSVLGCSLAMVFSLWSDKTHEALLGTYAVWGLWLLGPVAIRFVAVYFGMLFWTLPVWLNPFELAFSPYHRPGSVGWGDYFFFLGGTLAASAVLALLAVARLRPVCTRERARRGSRDGRVQPAWIATLRRWLPGPSLDFNPVLWREWHRNRPSRMGRGVGLLFFVLAAASTLATFFSINRHTNLLVNAFQVSVGLLLLSVSASTSLAEERTRGSIDVLLATPMSTLQIVLGKWLGTFRFMPLIVALPTLVIFSGSNRGPWMGPTAVLMAAYVTVAGAAVTGLGLAMATWCTGLGRSVGLTVTAYVVVTVGWMFLVMAMTGPHPLGFPLIAGSPFYGPIVITSQVETQPYRADFAACMLWVVAYAAAAAALLAGTLATFDRCLGRVESRPLSPWVVNPTPVELVRRDAGGSGPVRLPR